MDQGNQTTNTNNKIGFVIYDCSILSKFPNEFIQITGPAFIAPLFFPNKIFAKLKVQDQHHRNGIPFFYGSYYVVDQFQQKQELFLYVIPPSVGHSFLLRDLDMPVEVYGVIGIIEAAPGFMKNNNYRSWKEVLEHYRDDAKLDTIAWARLNNLPFTIVLIKEAEDVPMISINDLVEIYNLDPGTPIIDCSAGLNEEKVEEILRTTVNYIKP